MKDIINLNGQWDFVADLDPKYHNDVTIYPESPYARPDAERRHWKKVAVPGVWQEYGERYDIFEGVCWFTREFHIDDTHAAARFRLRFGGVNYYCRVFINGSEAGSHETGYTEFVIDATGKIKAGTNHIAVMVDNRACITKWPPCLGYFNYGGIHRDVRLEILEGACLDDIRLTGRVDGGCCSLGVKGKVLLYEASKQNVCAENMYGRMEAMITCNQLSHKVSINNDGTFYDETDLYGIKPWTPQEPNLYRVSVQLLVDGCLADSYEMEYGFKSINIHNGKVCINSTSIHLKGICYVYDSPVTGLVMTREQIEVDLALMKEMGCNAVRCHYPMDEKFYSACDRLGLLVWIEPTVYCYHPLDSETGTCFTDPEYTGLAGKMAVEMVSVAGNHPCVSIYGIGNECNTANAEAKGFFTNLAAVLRREDPSRLISYAALYGIIGPIAEIVDVLGINSYWGWYDKIFGGKGLKPESDEWQKDSGVAVEPIDLEPMRQMLDKALSESHRELVLFLTEFGADSVPGFYSKSRDLWSEDYHAALMKEIFILSQDYQQIAGTFPFCFSDYRDPSKVHNGYWNEVNLKGVVAYDRRKKSAFNEVKSHYEKQRKSI